MIPIVIDCEASGLDRQSYPIEVGYVLQDGEVTSYKIKPEPDWTFWDPEAEKIHNIPRCQLMNEKSAYDVANLLNSQLCGETVYSDAVDYELMWLNKLFSAAGVDRKFDVMSLQSLFGKHQYQTFYTIKEDLFTQCIRHRAGNDAWVLQQAFVRSV